jgi:hypothetical protein
MESQERRAEMAHALEVNGTVMEQTTVNEKGEVWQDGAIIGQEYRFGAKGEAEASRQTEARKAAEYTDGNVQVSGVYETTGGRFAYVIAW